MSDLQERSIEGLRTEQARFEAALRRRVLAALEVPPNRRLVVPGDHSIDRKVQAAVWKWVWRETAKDPRTLERQEVHPRCR